MPLQCRTFGANVLHCALSLSALVMFEPYLQCEAKMHVTLFSNIFRNKYAGVANMKVLKTAFMTINISIDAGILMIK